MTPALLREAATMSEPVNWDEAFEEAAAETARINDKAMADPAYKAKREEERRRIEAGIGVMTPEEIAAEAAEAEDEDDA